MTTISPEGAQMAADLANAEPSAVRNDVTADMCNVGYLAALARLCTVSIERDARLEEALADLREIAAHLDNVGADTHRLSNVSRSGIGFARAIAAKHRVETDPLVAAINAANSAGAISAEAFADNLRTELAKRGFTLAEVAK